ncbi:MAG: PHB depolymerase family esterase [Burkholderiales bacterium]
MPRKAAAATPASALGITETIQRALSSAGLDSSPGPRSGVARTIEKALSAAGLHPPARGEARTDEAQTESPALPAPELRSRFITREYRNEAGARTYKVYVPESYAGTGAGAVPLIVMLHGCTQSPDDFAAGTRMNELAEQHGYIVVYPAQAPKANGSKCWNWFRAEDQRRDRGEPSLIAGITREVAAEYRIDQRRIYVAGLSAGAAMAVILGVTYPELYAAVGAHSGLPYAAAHDVPSAFSAMKNGAAQAGVPAMFVPPRPIRAEVTHSVPAIVFHGDADRTVTPSNGAAIVEALVAAADQQNLRVSKQEGTTSSGRTYERTVYANAAGDAIIEHWVLHGGGHAWSGGNSNGSYTEPAGPDASGEMIRFFYAQKRPGTF